MSIVSVTELFDDHDGEVSVDGHRWERAFHVLTKDRTQWGPSIIRAVDSESGIRIPHIGELLTALGSIGADDTRVTAQRIRPQRVDGTPYLWKVVVEYSTRATDTPGEIEPNPIERPAEWSWGDLVSTEEYTHDAVTGKPVLNTAGEPYDPGLTREVTQRVLTLTWNALSFNPIAQEAYSDTVNAKDFTIGALNFTVGAGVAKVAHNTATGPHMEGGYPTYVRRTVELHLRKSRLIEWNYVPPWNGERWVSGWDHTPLSMGFQERKNKVDEHGNILLEYALTPILIEALDDEGKPTGEQVRPQEPVALNHIGQAILGIRPSGAEWEANPWVTLYQPYTRMNFEGLDLPQQ